MTPADVVTVTSANGLRGRIDTTTWTLDGSHPEVVVQLDDGRQMLVPLAALHRQEDGSYALHLDPAELETRQDTGSHVSGRSLVIPVMAETLEIDKRRVETGRVRIRKTVHEHEETVDPPLWREEVVIERVPINQVVNDPPAARTEGETLIIPLLEVVLVVETRLLLKEEVRITTRRIDTHAPQRITLRREEATVERMQRANDEGNPGTEE
jgi:uncharacterized protein (TIGR02271 family)